MQFTIKLLISAVVIAAVSEIARRVSWIAAILASLPLTSILALTWLYIETKDITKVSELSTDIFWAVLPSLIFFILLPAFLRTGMGFWLSLGLSSAGMTLAYTANVWLMKKAGVSL